MHRSKETPPSNDKRWQLVQATMHRNDYQPHALIETLHTVQETFGYLDNEALIFVSNSLHIALNNVYSAAAFYHFYDLTPAGEHDCSVCTGTTCYVKGARQILDHIETLFGIKPGETTADNTLSLTTEQCAGVCGSAPVVVMDQEIYTRATMARMDKKLKRAMQK